ncbi:MAG: sugar phosphate isomerase/epimerase family protein [Planctomycetaceae bacterium]
MNRPTRRQFLKAAAVTLALPRDCFSDDNNKQKRSLAGEVGITTSSLSGHLVRKPARGKFTLLELPRVLRDELDMRVIDLNTSSLASFEPKYLDTVRKAAADTGCVLTNLKLNQRGLDMSSPRKAVREKALREYERSLDAAARLGVKWARPLPLKKRPDMKLHVQSYRRLADYAAKHGIRMLVENYGWMESDADSVAKLIKAIGHNVAASPDTGNWKDNAVRYRGLKVTFPLAVTCDFKARKLGPKGAHKLYDLKRCFRIGRKAGFRGPWCLEHANADRKRLFRELAMLRDLLRKWGKGPVS